MCEQEFEEVEDDKPQEVSMCVCGYICMRCLGMSWIDFM